MSCLLEQRTKDRKRGLFPGEENDSGKWKTIDWCRDCYVARYAKSRDVPCFEVYSQRRERKYETTKNGTWEPDRGTCLGFRQLLVSGGLFPRDEEIVLQPPWRRGRRLAEDSSRPRSGWWTSRGLTLVFSDYDWLRNLKRLGNSPGDDNLHESLRKMIHCRSRLRRIWI